jgi:hypothetical protein
MALSRLAKKFRDQEPTKTTTTVTSRKIEKTTKTVAPAKAPSVPVAPPAAVEPVPAPEPVEVKPGKRQRQQQLPKRPKFVYVPTKTEKKPAATPAPLPPRSNKMAARMMTQNLALLPDDADARTIGPGGLGRI